VAEPGTGTALFEDPRRSQGMPGTRAPHVTLQRDGTPISTLDLFGKNFCALAGANGGAWCDCARHASAELGLPVDTWRIAAGEKVSDPESRFAEAYGLTDSGAVIVRPDGFVAWRSKDASRASSVAMRDVLSSILCRSD